MTQPHMVSVPGSEIPKLLVLAENRAAEGIVKQEKLQQSISKLDSKLKTILDSMQEYTLRSDLVPLPDSLHTPYQKIETVPRWGIFGYLGFTKSVIVNKAEVPPRKGIAWQVSNDVTGYLHRLLELSCYEAEKVTVGVSGNFKTPSSVVEGSGMLYTQELNCGLFITTTFYPSKEHAKLREEAHELHLRSQDLRRLHEQLHLDELVGGDIFMPVEDYAKLKSLTSNKSF